MSLNGAWHFILWMHYLGLSLWVGGIICLAGIAIPTVHHNLPSRALAEEITAKILKRLNFLETICCFMLLFTSFMSFRFVHGHQQEIGYLILTIIFMGLLTFYYSFILMPKLEDLKQRMPVLDNNAGQAAKAEFDRLHQWYVNLVSLNLALALIVLYVSVAVFK